MALITKDRKIAALSEEVLPGLSMQTAPVLFILADGAFVALCIGVRRNAASGGILYIKIYNICAEIITLGETLPK
jgi:hypothetical protein